MYISTYVREFMYVCMYLNLYTIIICVHVNYYEILKRNCFNCRIYAAA